MVVIPAIVINAPATKFFVTMATNHCSYWTWLLEFCIGSLYVRHRGPDGFPLGPRGAGGDSVASLGGSYTIFHKEGGIHINFGGS